MGCVVSTDGDDDGRRRIIGVSAAAGSHHHHIVSLTSSTYGILTSPKAYSSPAAADTDSSSSSYSSPTVAVSPPPPATQPQPSPDVINSWELMAGLPDRPPPSCTPAAAAAKPPRRRPLPLHPIDGNTTDPPAASRECDGGGCDGAVLYTTSLRAVRATFEACNAVRAALQAHGVAFRERDVSMDRGFRDELLRLLLLLPGGGATKTAAAPTTATALLLPRLFVRGRHVGGADEVLRLDEEGRLAPLLQGLPRPRGGTYGCDGCGGARFLPCFDCSGSRKLAVPVPKSGDSTNKGRRSCASLVVRCRECNENGLVLCPICS